MQRDKTESLSVFLVVLHIGIHGGSEYVRKKYNGICYLCGEACDWKDGKWENGVFKVGGNYPSREHVIPLSKGGDDTWSNLRLAHVSCNSKKGAKLLAV